VDGRGQVNALAPFDLASNRVMHIRRMAVQRDGDRIRPCTGNGSDRCRVRVRPANGGHRAASPAGVLDQTFEVVDGLGVVKEKANSLHAEVGQLFDERKHLGDAERLDLRQPFSRFVADVENDEA